MLGFGKDLAIQNQGWTRVGRGVNPVKAATVFCPCCGVWTLPRGVCNHRADPPCPHSDRDENVVRRAAKCFPGKQMRRLPEGTKHGVWAFVVLLRSGVR